MSSPSESKPSKYNPLHWSLFEWVSCFIGIAGLYGTFKPQISDLLSKHTQFPESMNPETSIMQLIGPILLAIAGFLWGTRFAKRMVSQHMVEFENRFSDLESKVNGIVTEEFDKIQQAKKSTLAEVIRFRKQTKQELENESIKFIKGIKNDNSEYRRNFSEQLIKTIEAMQEAFNEQEERIKSELLGDISIELQELKSERERYSSGVESEMNFIVDHLLEHGLIPEDWEGDIIKIGHAMNIRHNFIYNIIHSQHLFLLAIDGLLQMKLRINGIEGPGSFEDVSQAINDLIFSEEHMLFHEFPLGIDTEKLAKPHELRI